MGGFFFESLFWYPVKICNIGGKEKWFFSLGNSFSWYKGNISSFLGKGYLRVNYSSKVGKKSFPNIRGKLLSLIGKKFPRNFLLFHFPQCTTCSFPQMHGIITLVFATIQSIEPRINAYYVSPLRGLFLNCRRENIFFFARNIIHKYIKIIACVVFHNCLM
jgi:hypothetical protein